MSTGIVILAAGESKRIGEPKQLLAYRGKTLLQHAIDTALSLSGAPVIVVLGAHAATIRAQLDDTCAIVAENPAWREGMGTSVSTGLRTLLAAHPAISAAIFLVCDQPMLSATTLSLLVATHEQTGYAIVAAQYARSCDVPVAGSSRGVPAARTGGEDAAGNNPQRGRSGYALGVPALFAREFFPELLALEGPEGARSIIQKHRARAIGIPFPDGACDIDTPFDYARLRENFREPSTLTPV